jgi:hypothetical protein
MVSLKRMNSAAGLIPQTRPRRTLPRLYGTIATARPRAKRGFSVGSILGYSRRVKYGGGAGVSTNKISVNCAFSIVLWPAYMSHRPMLYQLSYAPRRCR